MARKGSKKSDELIDDIINRISLGEPLRQICRTEGYPSFVAVYEWIRQDPELSLRFARARELGYYAIAEETLDIADNATNDYMENIEPESGEATGYRLNGEHIQRSKLRVETRLKLLAKWSPKKYGDRVHQEITGADGGAIKTETNVTLSAEEAYKRMIDGNS